MVTLDMIRKPVEGDLEAFEQFIRHGVHKLTDQENTECYTIPDFLSILRRLYAADCLG